MITGADISLRQEHQRILDALEKTGDHRLKAARELCMERTTLWRKMKKYGIW